MQCDRSVTCQKPDLGPFQEFELCCVVDMKFRLISHVFVVPDIFLNRWLFKRKSATHYVCGICACVCIQSYRCMLCGVYRYCMHIVYASHA